MQVEVKIKQVSKDKAFKMPYYATDGSSCMDICSSEHLQILPNSTVAVDTNFSVEIPHGYEIQIRSRSGLALKHSVSVLNAPGTIDDDFRGTVKVILHNHGITTFGIDVGDRIAQMLITKVDKMKLKETDSLSDTARGAGGFGHTGVK